MHFKWGSVGIVTSYFSFIFLGGVAIDPTCIYIGDFNAVADGGGGIGGYCPPLTKKKERYKRGKKEEERKKGKEEGRRK